MFIALLAIAMVVVPEGMSVKQFSPAPKMVVPRALIESELCPDPDGKDCWQEFEETGKVWVGDVNGDSADELLIYPGLGFTGSGGSWYFLYQKRDSKWVSLFFSEDDEGWQIENPRFDILPTIRSGYHDLRLSADDCLKWNGTQYEFYDPNDYRQLPPEFFDATSLEEAEVLWRIRYEGLKVIQFAPQWFTLTSPWPKGAVELDDPEYNVKWVSSYKTGAYGIQDGRAFLLVPRLGYVGIVKLAFEGDWLNIFDDSSLDEDSPQPVARYNRRTRQLELLYLEKTN